MEGKQITKCRICGSSDLIEYLDLGMMPLVNALSKTEEEAVNQKRYPLNILLCKKCKLSQLSFVVNPEVMFSEYPYRSSISKTFVTHCDKLAEEYIKKLELTEKDMVVDIAGNDGALLQCFKSRGVQVLNVEPATNIAAVAINNGISTMAEFWGEKTSARLLKIHGQVKLIIGTNVFAHVDDVHSFIENAKLCLLPGGRIVLEFPYLVDLIEGNAFDTIYHEHLSYFLIAPLRELAEAHGLVISDIQEIPIHGGSVRVEFSMNFKDKNGIDNLYHFNEHAAGFHNPEMYLKWGSKVLSSTNKLSEELYYLKYTSHYKIAAFGASAKGNVLLNTIEADMKFIDYIVDDTPEKIGKFAPGTGIPIVSRKELEESHPDYLLITPWNFKDEIMGNTKQFCERGGRYIIPIPKMEIIGDGSVVKGGLTCIIPIHTPDLALFDKMLRSLKENTPELVRLIVVDNASENKPEELILSILPDATIVHNEKNMGVGASYNQVLHMVDTRYMATLNDDIEFFENWSTPMIAELESDKNVGQVGMREGMCNSWDWKGSGYYRDIDEPEYIEGSCMAMRTAVAREFGLFDEAYEFAYCEDGDLSMRLRQAGYKLRNVRVKWMHHRAVTSRKISNISGYEAKNKALFRKRYMAYLLTKDITKTRTIIIKRTGSLGDVFLTLPVVAAVREKYPDAAIIFETSNPQAIQYDNRIDLIVEPGFVIAHDMLINLDDAYEETPDMPWVECYAAKAGVVIKNKYSYLSLRDKDIEAIDTIIPYNFGKFAIFEASETWVAKQWPQENYKELALRLKDEGFKIVTIGTNRKIIDIPYDLNFVNTLDVLQTGAILRRAHFFVGHEGLVAHLALSMRVPSVILYGCTSPDVCNDPTAPYLKPILADIPCQGCRRWNQGNGIDCPIKFQCMKEIPVDKVFYTCMELMLRYRKRR